MRYVVEADGKRYAAESIATLASLVIKDTKGLVDSLSWLYCLTYDNDKDATEMMRYGRIASTRQQADLQDRLDEAAREATMVAAGF